MAYSNSTRFFRIPVMADGDVMTEEQEGIQLGVIDSLLYAAYFGCENGVLKEGVYSLSEDEGDSTLYNLTLSPIDGYSVMGIINKRMFYSTEELALGQFEQGGTYYVYAEYANGMEEDPTEFTINQYDEEEPETNSKILLCTVDFTGATPSLDTNVNKVYVRNIINHTATVSNPHGARMSQDNLDVLDALTVNGAAVRGAVYETFTSAATEQSIEVPDGLRPVFATIYPESTGVTNVAWRISEGVLYVTTSGSTGVTCNVKIDVEADA